MMLPTMKSLDSDKKRTILSGIHESKIKDCIT
jgi:hypothetical protein